MSCWVCGGPVPNLSGERECLACRLKHTGPAGAARPDWEEWRDLKFMRYLSHADYVAILFGNEQFNGAYLGACRCGGWQRYFKTDSGHQVECPLHAEILKQMELNPR